MQHERVVLLAPQWMQRLTEVAETAPMSRRIVRTYDTAFPFQSLDLPYVLPSEF